MTFINQSKTEIVHLRAVNRHGFMVDIASIEPGCVWPTRHTPAAKRRLVSDLDGSLFAFTDGGIANVLCCDDDHPAVIEYARRASKR